MSRSISLIYFITMQFFTANVSAQDRDAFSSPWTVADLYQMERAASCVLADYRARIPESDVTLYLLSKAYPDNSEMNSRISFSRRSDNSNGPQPMRKSASFVQFPAHLALWMYQKLISPTKGRNCLMSPSCSVYSVKAIQQNGVLQGLLMTADRLHRCGHDGEHYVITQTKGGARYEDTVISNTLKYYKEHEWE